MAIAAEHIVLEGRPRIHMAKVEDKRGQGQSPRAKTATCEGNWTRLRAAVPNRLAAARAGRGPLIHLLRPGLVVGLQ